VICKWTIRSDTADELCWYGLLFKINTLLFCLE